MGISVQGNVILVVHDGTGNEQEAQALCTKLHQLVIGLSEGGRKVGIFHDASDLAHATEGYARRFASCFEDIRHLQPVQVALVDRAILRVLAKVAMTLSGTDMKICRSRDECMEYLRERGFAAY